MRVVSRTLFVVAALLSGVSRASATTIDFDAMDAFVYVSGAPLAAYLGQYGVTYTYTGMPGAVLMIADDDNIYGTGVIQASSGENVLLSSGNRAQAGSFQLFFDTPQDYVSFTRTAVLQPSAYPQWSATPYAGSVPGLTVFQAFFSGTSPAITFTLGTPGDSIVNITSVAFSYNGFGFAGFDSPVIDDLVLPNSSAASTPEPTSMLLLGSGLAGIAYKRRRKREK